MDASTVNSKQQLLDNDEIIGIAALNTGGEYTVAFTGFAPGFVYLSGGHRSLNVPRRSTPRTRLPAPSTTSISSPGSIRMTRTAWRASAPRRARADPI